MFENTKIAIDFITSSSHRDIKFNSIRDDCAWDIYMRYWISQFVRFYERCGNGLVEWIEREWETTVGWVNRTALCRFLFLSTLIELYWPKKSVTLWSVCNIRYRPPHKPHVHCTVAAHTAPRTPNAKFYSPSASPHARQMHRVQHNTTHIERHVLEIEMHVVTYALVVARGWLLLPFPTGI